MALNQAVLAALIKTKVELATGNAMPAVTLAIYLAIAEAIVQHITTNAVLVTACPAGVGSGTVT